MSKNPKYSKKFIEDQLIEERENLDRAQRSHIVALTEAHECLLSCYLNRVRVSKWEKMLANGDYVQNEEIEKESESIAEA